MNNEQKLAVIEALKTYIPAASAVKDDVHIKLLEDAVAELEAEVTLPHTPEELETDDSF